MTTAQARTHTYTLRTIALGALLTPALLATSAAHAELPAGLVINFQGFLTDLDDKPISDVVDVQVRIYASPSGGAELYFEQHSAVAVEDGVVRLPIGAISRLTEAIFEVEGGLPTGGGRYIGLTIAGDTAELAPRFPIGVVPFAIRSLLGDGMEGPRGATEIGRAHV